MVHENQLHNLVGQVPFGGESVVQVYENIIRGEIFFPSNMTPSSRSIISGLLQVDRTQRLGNMRNGASDVKNHEWVNITFVYI